MSSILRTENTVEAAGATLTSIRQTLEQSKSASPPAQGDIGTRHSAVSFREPPPRPRRSDRRPSPRTPDISVSSVTSKENTESPSQSDMKATCGYCSDHGELMKNHSHAQASRRRAKSLSTVSPVLSNEPEDNKGKCCDGHNIFCMLCDNASYMPPEGNEFLSKHWKRLNNDTMTEPEILLQLAQALERKAQRYLFKAEVLRWCIQSQSIDASGQFSLPETLSQKVKKLGVNVSDLSSIHTTPEMLQSYTLPSPVASESSTLPTPIVPASKNLMSPRINTPYSTSLSGSFPNLLAKPQLSPGIYNDTRSDPQRTLKKRRPEFLNAEWPELRRQRSLPGASKSRLQQLAHGEAKPEEQMQGAGRRPSLRRFFSTRSGDQFIPFLRRSVHK